MDTTAGDDSLNWSTTLLGSLLARAETGPTPGAAADLPGLDLAAQDNVTALSKVLLPRRPAASRPGNAIGRTVAREQLGRRVGRPALLNNQG